MAENLKQTIEFQAKGIAKLKKQYKELEQRTRGLEGATNKAGGSLGGLVAKLGLTTVALYGSMRAISSVVRVGADFEKKMSNVAAISGATAEELKALESNAKQLGATTVFTASQVAELQTEFAKLGFTSTEIRGVTKDTLALAAASGSDLATSAAVAGQTLRAFGLDVSETSRVTDTMALSFSASALDMDKFTNSMQYVAPVAKAVGFSVEGTTALLGGLANAGISGSLAGTALRTVFLKLADSNSDLTKRLGGSVKSADELIPALKKLSDSGVDLTEVLGLVDKRAVSAFKILLDGTEDIAELKEELDGASGAAQRMADVQLDNLAGKATLLNSAMEGLAITIFDTFDEKLKGAVTQMTGLVTSVDSFLQQPISDKLRDEQTEFNILMDILDDVNTSQDTRNKAVEELQNNYGNYIGNIDLESASQEQLRGILKQSNEEFEKGIELEAQREILVAQRSEQIKLQKDIFLLEQKVREEKENHASVDFSLMGTTFRMNNELKIKKQRLEEVKEKNKEFIESLGSLNLKVDETTGTIVRFGDEAAGAYKKVGEAAGESAGDGEEAEDKLRESKEKSLESSLKGVAMSRDLESASKSLAKQYVVEGVFDAVKSAITAYPFPINIAFAATAAAAANALFSAIIPAATGFEGVVDRPTMFMTGEGNKKEHVSVTPLESPNINGPQGGGITVNISGGVVNDDYVRNTLLPALNKAGSMGA